MSPAVPTQLTVGDVYRLGGWDVRYARVYALGSAGSVACSITDTNGDQRELSHDYWRYEADGWRNAGGELNTQDIGGGFHPDGILRWSDDHDEHSAIYCYDDQAGAPGSDLTRVGQMVIESTPIPRTLPAIVGDFRGRAPVAALTGCGRSFDENLGLVLVLLDSGEDEIALRALCDAINEFEVSLYRSEYVELSREAARLQLLDDEWARVERLVQD